MFKLMRNYPFKSAAKHYNLVSAIDSFPVEFCRYDIKI